MFYVIRQYTENDLSGILSSWENASKIAHPFLTNGYSRLRRFTAE